MADDRVRLNGRFCKKTKRKRAKSAEYRNRHIDHDHEYASTLSPVSPIVNVDNVAENVTIGIQQSDLDKDNGQWKDGRRIVELAVLAEQLFCNSCLFPLNLKDIVGEIR